MPDDQERGRARDEGAAGAPPFLYSHVRDAADAAARNRLRKPVGYAKNRLRAPVIA